jgi:hypothetical protein
MQRLQLLYMRLHLTWLLPAAGTPALNGLGFGAADRPGLGSDPAADTEADGEAPGGLGLGAMPGLGATPGLGASDHDAAEAPTAGLGGFTSAGLGSETPGNLLHSPHCFVAL